MIRAGLVSERRTPRSLVTLLAVVVCVSLPFISGCASHAKEKGDYDSELQEKMGELGKSYDSMDVDKIATLYSADSFAHAFELPFNYDTNAREHNEDLGKFLGRVQNLSFKTTGQVQTWKHKGRTWTLIPVHVAGTMKDGRNIEFDGQHSAIWEKHDGRWIIIHEHYWGPHAETALAAARPVPPPPPPPPPPPAPAPAPAPPPPPPVPEGLRDIFYDFDKSNVRGDQTPAADHDAAWMKEHPSTKVTIEGHCDERGTRAYNMALGSRRADSAKEALIERGVDAGRIKTISYGKERPFEPGHDEEAWAKNRRSHFIERK